MKRKMNNEENEGQFLHEENSVPRVVSFDPEVVFSQDRMTYDPSQLRNMFDAVGGELDLKSPSFDGNSLMDPTLLLTYSREDQEGFYFRPQFPSFEEHDRSAFFEKPVDPSVVPASSSSVADPFKAEAKSMFHPHNLRPKRNSPKFRDFSSMLTSDEEEDGADDGEDEEYKEELEVDNEESDSKAKPKKRAYYRKNQYPKEFLAKVEAERLQKKRLKNRELAAKSRQKKKQKMSDLEEENSRLQEELLECKALLSQCHCRRQ